MTQKKKKILDFEACIRDIDDAINAAPMITHSSFRDPVTHADNIGKYSLTNGNISLASV